MNRLMNATKYATHAFHISIFHSLYFQYMCQLSKYIPNLNILKVVGGEPIPETARKVLEAPQHIVVGTPGRVAHMLQNEIIDAKNISLFVLDDGDELLTHGFQDKVVEINDYVPKDAQTIFVSFVFFCSFYSFISHSVSLCQRRFLISHNRFLQTL